MKTKQQDIIDICPDLAAWPVVQVGTPEEMAKVRRIEAAAPDLLAALEILLDAAMTYLPEYCHGVPTKKITRQAVEAIAKAKGE